MASMLSGTVNVVELERAEGNAYVTLQGIKFYPGDSLIFNNGILAMARFTGEHVIGRNTFSPEREIIQVNFDAQGHPTAAVYSQPLRVNGILFRPGYLYFFPSGHFSNGHLLESAEFDGISIGPGDIFFYPDGRLKYGILSKEQRIQDIPLKGKSAVFLFHSGRLDTFTPAEALVFDRVSTQGNVSLHENGKPHVITGGPNNQFHFDENGQMMGSPSPYCFIRNLQIGINVENVLKQPYCELRK